MTLLSEQQAAQISAAIADVEHHTDGELVTVLASRADDYVYIPALWAALIALLSPGIVMLTPFWLGMAEILVVQLAAFIVLALILRIPFILRHIIPGSVKRWRAGNMARRMFLENNLHHTVGETGLLIFVAEAERYVEVIADRGICEFVSDEQWQVIVDELTESLHQGETLQGFLGAIQTCGGILSQHIPATHEKNELPNHLIVL